jgi:hypothetical protein
MVNKPVGKLAPDQPWQKYSSEKDYLLLEPGWAGALMDDELEYIRGKLRQDAALCRWWGVRPSWKRIPEEAIKRVALEGDPEEQAINRRLAQSRKYSPVAT